MVYFSAQSSLKLCLHSEFDHGVIRLTLFHTWGFVILGDLLSKK